MSNEITCPSCGGDGSVSVPQSCGACGGSGEISETITETVDGHIESRTVSRLCSCGGVQSNAQRCSSCGGTGRIFENYTSGDVAAPAPVTPESGTSFSLQENVLGTIYALLWLPIRCLPISLMVIAASLPKSCNEKLDKAFEQYSRPKQRVLHPENPMLRQYP